MPKLATSEQQICNNKNYVEIMNMDMAEVKLKN